MFQETLSLENCVCNTSCHWKGPTYDGPNGSLFISILLHNSKFRILSSEFRNLHYEFRNSELWSICNVDKRSPLIYSRGYFKPTDKNKRQHDLNWWTYKCFYQPFECIAMTPYCVICFLINYSKQSSSKMIYVCKWVDYQLNRRKKNISVFYRQLSISQSRSSSQTTSISKYLFCS